MALDTLLKRIEDKVMKRGPRQCWPWLGYINADGEARIWVDDALGSISVPKAYYLARGEEIPDGKEALSCPILKDCANPDHHSLGTRDDVAARRLWTMGLERRGPKNQRRKLSDEEVRQIFLSDDATSVVARRYNTTDGQVANIRAGRKHRRVTDPLKPFQPTQIKDARKENALAIQVGRPEAVHARQAPRDCPEVGRGIPESERPSGTSIQEGR